MVSELSAMSLDMHLDFPTSIAQTTTMKMTTPSQIGL